jgi:hypothetical protein
MSTINTSFPAPEPKYLDLKGLQAYLKIYAGFAPSKSFIYKAVMLCTIPVHRGPGGRLLFPISEIRDWIENGGRFEGGE